MLQAGTAYTGNFILPAKQGSGKWITIRTSNMAGLPQEGTRVGPRHAAAMPKIVDPNGSGAINTALRAGYYRLIGLDVTLSPKAKLVWALVNLGNGGKEQNSLDLVAHHLILDRMYIHGDPKHDCFRCVALNSASSAVIDSYLSEGHANGFDAQAICCNNGPGPFKIVNNYLEGAGENVMFGGADPAIRDLVPSDIEFRSNYCFKPLSWKIGHPSYAGIPWAVKNLFELKNARRVLIEGNLFENNWVHQPGRAEHPLHGPQPGRAPHQWSSGPGRDHDQQPPAQLADGVHPVMGYDYPQPKPAGPAFPDPQQCLRARRAQSGFMVTWGADDVEIDHNTFLPANYLPFVMSGLKGHDAAGKVLGIPCRAED